MTQVSEKVIAKLAKIRAHQESAAAIGSEEEAKHFARMLQELLMRHKLEMSDIEYDQEVKDEPIEEYPVGGKGTYRDGKYVMEDYPEVEIRRRRQDWSERLGRIVAEAHGCKMLVSTGSSRLWFVGRKSNVAVAEYMYITMYRTIESLSWKEYKTARNKTKWEYIKNFPKAEQASASKDVDYSDLEGYRSSWIEGFISGLNMMFMAEEVKRTADAAQSTALVRINKDKQAVNEYLQKFTGKVNRLGGSGRGFNSRGYTAGKNKANEVGITAKGMGASGKSGGQLK
jgi:hypothetical protein